MRLTFICMDYTKSSEPTGRPIVEVEGLLNAYIHLCHNMQSYPQGRQIRKYQWKSFIVTLIVEYIINTWYINY